MDACSALDAADVAVIGGGPAGTAAALSLRQLRPSLHVVVVEASQYDQWRIGESLAPGCLQLLDSLGCGDRFRAERFIESFGTCSSWGSAEPYDNEFLFSTHGNAWQVDRSRFDAMLADCAEHAGAAVLRDSRLVECGWAEGRWNLAIGNRRSAAARMTARFVIDATGRSASFAVQQGSRRVVMDHLAGAFVRFRFGADTAPADTRTLVEAAEDGWWYSSITPDYGLPGSRTVTGVAAWMSDSDLIRSRNLSHLDAWLNHFSQSRLTSARFASGEPEMTVSVWAAQSHRLMPATGSGWIATGDAASTFDPLSSQGILKALRSGKLASFVAIDCLEDRSASRQRYEKLLADEFEQYLAMRTSYYRQEQRWPTSLFWSRRHSSATPPS